MLKEKRAQRQEEEQDTRANEMASELEKAYEWMQELAPKHGEALRTIMALEAETEAKDYRIRQLEAQLAKWESGEVVNAEVVVYGEAHPNGSAYN